MNQEQLRLKNSIWKKWGPYVTDRQWGTVREDYSEYGTAWEYVSHDMARSKTYRWGEEGIAGISDDQQLLCFAVALWNKKDPIIKERYFGLTGNEGNHGEDVKELYYYLDSTPTHSYMKMLYKYPQNEFPYAWLLEENRRRGKQELEFELIDTGIFNEDKYFDVFTEYAKAGEDSIFIKITVHNRGNEDASLHVLPTLWFRNTWEWGYDDYKPKMMSSNDGDVIIDHKDLGQFTLHLNKKTELLFCDNETNLKRLYGVENTSAFTKDGVNEYLVHGNHKAINTNACGTKVAVNYDVTVKAGTSATIRLRLEKNGVMKPFEDFDNFFYYDIEQWLKGDPAQPAPPAQRRNGRNHEWLHLNNADIISMPDKWEYPWYAAWDLAFHCIPLSLVDPDFAKRQLLLLTKEWYMHPNGQLPAYEWAFGDVNPPVHAWAAWRVYKIDKKRRGVGDRAFLARIFQKLLLNFTWWVNRKDSEGRNVFQGGFLGLDNIGVFDRSAPLPTGGHIEQADGTGWMAMYCLNLLAIAMELASEDPSYEDVASKFWEHFLYIANAINHLGSDGTGMWSEEDGFFYDVLHMPDDGHVPLKVRSIVGLIPLFAVETIEPRICDRLEGFKRRLEWFVEHRQDLTHNVACMHTPGEGDRRLLSIVDSDQLRRILRVMLDEREFLSPYGIRAISRIHHEQPYVLRANGMEYRVDYEPGESSTGLFGGNSNWRGPIWFPVNFLLIESLQKFHHYL